MQIQIRPQNSFVLIDWKLISQYRDLLWLWVKRDITSKYRQTILGPLWFAFQPLVTALVFVVVFSKGLKISTEGVPPALFYLSGLLVWNYVSQSLNSTSMTLIAHSGLFKKVFFPRLILPFSYCVSSLVSLAIQLAVLSLVYVLSVAQGSGVRPGPLLVLMPILILQMLLLSFGLGLWLSALSVRYRDFHHLWSLISPLWLYATPVSYPLSAIPENWRWVMALNPLTSIIEGIRAGLLQTGVFDWGLWTPSLLSTSVLVLSGVVIFQSVERNCVDSL